MNKVLCFILFSLLAFPVAARDNDLRIVYDKFNFYVPSNPNIVAYLGTNSDILVAKYSDEPGKKIVGFSLDRELVTGGCRPMVFFEAVISESKSECDFDAVKAFRYVFVKDRDAGVWSGGGYKFFYFIGVERSMIFMVAEEDGSEIYKIESDFLEKEELKNIFTAYF